MDEKNAVLIARRTCFAAAALSGLLAVCCAKADEIGAPGPQNAQGIGQPGVPPVAPAPPGTRGGLSPQLPEISPGPPPPPGITAPIPPSAAPEATAPALRQGPQFVLRDVN